LKKENLLNKSSFYKEMPESGDNSIFAHGWRSSRSGNIELSLLLDKNFKEKFLKETFLKDTYF